MRELEASLQQFGGFILKAQLVKDKAAPFCVRWVRRFLTRPASDEPLADQVRKFCEELERNGGCQDWQVRQAEHALQIYFVNFLQRTDWHRRPASAVVDEQGRTNPLAALEQLRRRIRSRHYSYRTECSYADWVRRFLTFVTRCQPIPAPASCIATTSATPSSLPCLEGGRRAARRIGPVRLKADPTGTHVPTPAGVALRTRGYNAGDDRRPGAR